MKIVNSFSKFLNIIRLVLCVIPPIVFGLYFNDIKISLIFTIGFSIILGASNVISEVIGNIEAPERVLVFDNGE